ncbi:VPS10 domain-containing protein [Microbacterium gallinarum]|uniref:Glycosyl hydrolase n=1 Tax=Microbacterium gallinarum TaxID=2762209 RepID=A0ABR8X1Z7_9MICO|nr:glycosyl hydrolase [Microbacterium gallinarum]MBD8023274.1 glycosyl hydrolase [Microbacterium gallinarum]
MTATSQELAEELGADVIRWRSVGPSRGGRVVAVSGDRHDSSRFWMGACSGGVWMTDDAGQYWRPMSDGFLETASIGAIAVSESDSNVVWVGTGESFARNNVVPGDGVYRTVDGGRTWQHRGLAATKHIAKLRVHPKDPDVAYVAATGDVFGPNPERGVFRTRDGGETWDHVLHVSDKAGGADLVIDPSNPRIVYASIWQMVRHPWNIISGGEDSGLWRSADAGDTWEKISDNPGFASGLLGRIGVAASPAKPGRLWALVEAIGEEGGVYRSEDSGQTWEHVSRERSVQGRPWYYSHIIAHPTEADTVWSMNTWAWRSRDGGRTFQQVQTPHGDNHDLWIDPDDPRRMINGNDGGACVSVNGGMTWSSVYNQATAQFYRFDIDHRFPFDLYATQQDNSGIRAPSRSWKGALRWPDCVELGEAEAGDVALDRSDPRFVMLGGAGFGHPGPLLRFDQVTEQARDVAVWPEYFMGVGASEMTHRFGWTYPIEFSPHEPGVLYVGGERLFRSPDGGITWSTISPDLTRDDKTKQQPTGGPISGDSTGAEVYCTIYAFAESPLTAGELWVGTDDGLVHLSRDGGESWTQLTVPGLPDWATIARIEPSAHHAGTAYLAAHAYRIQDPRPLVFRTDDFGATWEPISAGIPEQEWARSIREDPSSPELLFLATERRVWFSVDRGATWASLRGNMPSVPVYDVKVRDHELVAGTHGRAFWILDDLAPLRQIAGARLDEPVLFAPPLAYRYATPDGFDMPGEGSWVGGFPGVPLGGATFTRRALPDGTKETVWLDGGKNPPNGVQLIYRLPADADDVTLTIRDAGGTVLRTFGSTSPADRDLSADQLTPRTSGTHAFVWDLRIEPALAASTDGSPRGVVYPGPRVAPGRYTVTLEALGTTVEQPVMVERDPRGIATDDDLAEQHRLLVRIRDLLQRVADGIGWATATHASLEALRTRLDGRPLAERIGTVADRIDALLRVLTNPDMKDHNDALKMAAGLEQKIVLLPEIVVELSDTRPVQGVYAVLDRFEAEADDALAGLDDIRQDAIPELDSALRADSGIPLIAPAE